MDDIKAKLTEYAERYETKDFLAADPAFFMHQTDGQLNQETIALIAACLSYGSRKQFFPKIQFVLDASQGEVYKWVKDARFHDAIPANNECYYRLYTKGMMNSFLCALQKLLSQHGSLKSYVEHNATDGYGALLALTNYFAEHDPSGVVPKNAASACKRLCMFLRWMVRDASPVDLGLWADIIDKRTLIMPLDTHVLTQACRLKLLNNKTSSMSVAKKLTNKMLQYFPDDPLKGDFALFGYGVNH